METMMPALAVIIYVLAIILLLVLIILGIRLIQTIDKATQVIEDIEKKTKSLNGIFNMIDTATDRLSFMSNALVEGIVMGISKIFNRKNKKENDENE